MQELEIEAAVEYYRPLPYYLPARCRQEIIGFVYGNKPAKVEMRGLRSFRSAIIKLAQEALVRFEECESLETPYITVILKGGKDTWHQFLDYQLSFGLEGMETRDKPWVVHHGTARGTAERHFASNGKDALLIVRQVLDRVLHEWAARVSFSN